MESFTDRLTRTDLLLVVAVPALLVLGFDLVYEPEVVELVGGDAQRYAGLPLSVLVLPGVLGLGTALAGLAILPRWAAPAPSADTNTGAKTNTGANTNTGADSGGIAAARRATRPGSLPGERPPGRHGLLALAGLWAFGAALAIVVAAGLGGGPTPEAVWTVVGGLAAGALAAGGLGALVGSLARSARAAVTAGSVLLWPMAFVAGVFAYGPLMSDTMQRVAGFTPVGAMVQLVQHGWFGPGQGAGPGTLTVVLVAWAAVCWATALWRRRRAAPVAR